MLRQHRCRNCQKWYWTNRGDQIYCSRLCYYDYKLKIKQREIEKKKNVKKCGNCFFWFRGGAGSGRGGGTCSKWKIPKHALNILAPTGGCWMPKNENVIMAIVGSRRRTDEKNVRETVRELYAKCGVKLIIVSGGCAGVDTWAENEARKLGIPDDRIKIFKPDMEHVTNYHEAVVVYHKRNKEIAEFAVDGIIAFVANNRKGGTENTIKHAKKLGRNIILR